MSHRVTGRFIDGFLIALALAAAANAQSGLKRYDSKYYTVYSDLDRDAVREAILRMTHMAEEYHARTTGFAGEIRGKLPFYLFSDVRDYIEQGGPRGSAGVFTGDRLMALAGPEAAGQTWHTVQHEGFHQFVHAVIGGDIPIWANEGLAEYFGEGVYTGDGFVTGLVPPQRQARVKKRMADKQFKSLERMMLLSHELWNAEGSVVNYDQAWSMIHFLAHGDGGKYQKPFSNFLKAVSHGASWQDAWKQNMGRDVAAFEERWRTYWNELPENPTADLYAKARVATLTSFLARAQAQKQFFETTDEFFEAAAAGKLQSSPDDWLPPALLEGAVKDVRDVGAWSFERNQGGRKLVCELPGGTRIAGTYKLRGTRVQDVEANIQPAAGKPAAGAARSAPVSGTKPKK